MDNNLGYVAIDLSKASKKILFDTVSQKIPEKDYFRSFDPDYTYINGNVSLKGHLTICYGTKNPDFKKGSICLINIHATNTDYTIILNLSLEVGKNLP